MQTEIVPVHLPLFEICFSTLPRVFTKLMKNPVAILRRLNILLIQYLDDDLIIARSQKELILAWDLFIFSLQNLGFR